MKTKEELNALKEEVETMNRKLAELSEDELKQVSSGTITPGEVKVCPLCGEQYKLFHMCPDDGAIIRH